MLVLLLNLLARLQGARTILEIGTLGGYSTIWLARAVPESGGVVTLEFDPKHAAIAKANFVRAGLADLVEVRVGRALDTLPELEREGYGPFDMTFIDADKPSIPEYFEWALKLSRLGSLIIVDNVVRSGAVADPESTDPNVVGVRRFNELLARAVEPLRPEGRPLYGIPIAVKDNIDCAGLPTTAGCPGAT